MVATKIPSKATVLVIGGGPGGSFTASALAREGIETVLLEGDVFPRYHVGESMLASVRHFLKFIDLDETFDKYGFRHKNGAAFKLNGRNREGYTDFIAAGGPNGYAWNVIRSESDNLMFKHAGKSGAKIFDGVRVNTLEFAPLGAGEVRAPEATGRPVSASYSVKATGETGTIKFDYLVDASGRNGVLNKYLKSRKYNKGLKNIANWAYWKNAGSYGVGTNREGDPYFEALLDQSGWAWFIPLHDGTTSVGVVMNQDIANSKKKTCANTQEYYENALKLVPNLRGFIGDATLATEVKSASDYSYSSGTYAIPGARVVGDAGCFIDPFFSSGVHLALSSGLSAATTICATIRGNCTEDAATKWHSQKVADGYERFHLVVLSGYRQMRKQDEAVLSDIDEDNFDRAFAFFRPIIQGSADTPSTKLTQSELSKTLDFCAYAFEPNGPEDRIALLQKANPNAENVLAAAAEGAYDEKSALFNEGLNEEEQNIANRIKARKMMRMEDAMDIDNFKTDVIQGYAPVLERGRLGLVALA